MSKIISPITNDTTVEDNVLDWKKILIEIKKNLGQDIFESWIKNISLTKELSHYVILSVPTRFIRDWIVSRYADKILDILKKSKKSVERIEFIIENRQNVPTNSKSYNFSNVSPIEDSILNYNRLDTNKSFENFVVGDSNRLAYTAAKGILGQSNSYNPLFIHGGVGMGKTHLLNSVGLQMQEKFNVMFISAERFMYHFIKSIKKNEMVKFKEFFRTSDVFIIDDIQFVRGKEAMQEEFFHTFNALMERGSQIIISSDRSPNKLDRIQDRIKSRLSGGLVVDIQPSDFNLRVSILKKKYEDIKNTYNDNFNLSDEILSFLGSEIKVSVREMIGALNRILAFSRIYNKTPTLSECKVVLKDIVDANENIITIENIQNIVASYYKISLEEMLSPRRSRDLVRPRQIAMYLSKKYTTKSLPEIGRHFLNRDHTTVIHGVEKIRNLMPERREIYDQVTALISAVRNRD